jgi:BarA-like signal transduction histidine kinase
MRGSIAVTAHSPPASKEVTMHARQLFAAIVLLFVCLGLPTAQLHAASQNCLTYAHDAVDKALEAIRLNCQGFSGPVWSTDLNGSFALVHTSRR